MVHRDLAGPVEDLTGTGEQSSGKVVHRDLTGSLGDLSGTGDQPSGKVVLVISCRTSQGNNQHEQSNKGGRGRSQVGQSGIVEIQITLKEISVKLDKRNPIVLKKFLLKQAWKQVYGFLSRDLAAGA